MIKKIKKTKIFLVILQNQYTPHPKEKLSKNNDKV